MIEEDKMSKNYVFGWYLTSTERVFRYPAERRSDLRQEGREVTVQVYLDGKWRNRRGQVIWGGGNYTVLPLRKYLQASNDKS